MAGDVYECHTPFLVKLDGADRVIGPRTTVREGHELLALYPDHFMPLRVDYEFKPEPEKPADPPKPRTRTGAKATDE